MSRSCAVCGGPTEPLHQAVPDYYFGSGFTADYRVCADPRCRTVVQDPLPEPSEIGKLYGSYYTHAHLSLPKRIERHAGGLLQRALLARFREPGRSVPLPLEVLRTGNVALDVAGIVPGGERPSVLDVGCGNGDSLAILTGLGYAVACGVETDERACEAARALGHEVRPGTAESIPWEDASFDVVFLRHVIEHVHDPLRALREALRVVRPGGLVSLLTPNAASHSHERHRHAWRGLESPRHLTLFTPGSLAALVERAGGRVERRGANDRSRAHIDEVSSRCARERAIDLSGAGPFFSCEPSIERGEEIFLVARRPG